MSSSSIDETKLPENLSNLPAAIEDLVQQYQDEKTYLTSVNSSNPLARNQIILDELESIDLQMILQFKLSVQLAKNYLKQYDNYIQRNNSKIDLNTLTGIFNILLNHYTYEQLLDFKSLIYKWVFQEAGNSASVGQLIDHLVLIARELNNTEFYDAGVMEKKLGRELHQKVLKIYRESVLNDDDSEELNVGEIFRKVYKIFLEENPMIADTISWDRNKELYIKYLEEHLTTLVPKQYWKR